MKKIQVQGVHHVTLVGSTKKSAVDFWQGVSGMPFIFEQPKLGNPEENHLYFDPGDGRLLTVFRNERGRMPPARRPAKSVAWTTSLSMFRGQHSLKRRHVSPHTNLVL